MQKTHALCLYIFYYCTGQFNPENSFSQLRFNKNHIYFYACQKYSQAPLKMGNIKRQIQLLTEAFSVITDDCLGLRWASKCLLIECLYFRVRTAAALPQNRK